MKGRTKAALLLAGIVSSFSASAQSSTENTSADQAQSIPRWSGYWVPEGQEATISGFPEGASGPAHMKLAGFNAPWNEAGRARFAAMMDAIPGRKAVGFGYPMMMNSLAPLQFIITPEETLVINSYRDVRHIYTDGRAHPLDEDLWPTPWGEAVGRWEGDTLVVETIAVKFPPDYFFIAPPLSEQARYVERIRRVAPDRLEADFTIVDPETLAQPWSVKMVYKPLPALDRLIHEAFDNDRSGFDGRFFTIEPSPTN